MKDFQNPNLDGIDSSDGFDGSKETGRGTVLDRVRHHLGKYLMPASDADLDLIALWAVHTHLARESYTTPRLLITSPMPGSGKTTVLDHLERLVPHATPMASVSSSALIPRIIASVDTVLLIDEAEKALSPNKPGIEDVLGVLNSGYRIGGSRPVLTPSKDDGWKAESMPTFAPAAMAGNAPNLPEDTMQRAISVTMFPAQEGDVEESDWEMIDADVRDLGLAIAEWADTIRDELRITRPPVPKGCIGRIKERWLPLKRVAVFIGGDWPERVDQMIIHDLDEIARDRDEGLSSMPPHIHLIRDIHRIFEREQAEFLPTASIITGLVSEHPDKWGSGSTFGKDLTSQRLGRMLVKNFSIRSTKDNQDVRGILQDTFSQRVESYRPPRHFRQFNHTHSYKPSKPSEPSKPSVLCDGCTPPNQATETIGYMEYCGNCKPVEVAP